MVHPYTHCTGYVYTGGSLSGYVEGDFNFEKETGEYIEQGSDTITDHTRGMRRVTGHIQRAWCVDSDDMYDWFEGDEEKTVVFYPKAGSDKTYTASGCVLTNVSGSISAGGNDPLMIDADFVGKSWSSGDTGA